MKLTTALGCLAIALTACGANPSNNDGPLSGKAEGASSAASLVGLAGKCLDVNGNNSANGTKIQLWDCNGSGAQAWTYDGTQMIASSGKCLDIPGNNQTDGNALQLYDCNGTDAQKWTFQGSTLVSAYGKCADVTAVQSTNGTVIELWDCNGGPNQDWTWSGQSAPTPPSPPPPSPSSSDLIRGVYCGNDPNDVLQYESWLGHQTDGILGYTGNASWADYDGSVGWAIGVWNSIDRRVLWSIPLIPNGANLGDAANGAYNDHYRAAAQQLAQFRPNDDVIYIRTAWEMNGNWFPWTAQGQPDNFRNAFRNFVQTFRSVSNRFVFEWNVNIGAQGMPDLENAYPGDDVVDIVGMDVYYNTAYYPADDTASGFATMRDQDFGLNWHQNFAAQHGKRTAYSEWGIDTDNAGPYLDLFTQWMKDHDVVYASYWNSQAAYPGQLSNGQYPNAGSEYRKDLFQ